MRMFSSVWEIHLWVSEVWGLWKVGLLGSTFLKCLLIQFADLYLSFSVSLKTNSFITIRFYEASWFAFWRFESVKKTLHTATLDCCRHCDTLITRHHVLPPVVIACSPHPKASQPSLVVQSFNVHGLLSTEFPVGAETLHNLCLGLLGRFVPYLLQLLGKLFLVSLLWLPPAWLCSWSQHSWHLKLSAWLQDRCGFPPFSSNGTV